MQPNDLKDILLANSPLTEGVLEALVERVPRLPKNTMMEIQARQTGTSQRRELEREISYYESEASLDYDALLRHYLHDPEVTDGPGKVEQMMRDRERKSDLANTYVLKKEFDKAEQTIAEITDPGEADLVSITRVNIKLARSEKAAYLLKEDAALEAEVRRLAALETTRPEKAAAQALLAHVFNEEIPLTFEELVIENPPQVRKRPFGEEKDESLFIINDKPNVQLYPNPANNNVTISYNFPEGGKLSVYNALGQLLIDVTLLQGANYINTNDLPQGLYQFLITVNKNTIAREKVIIIK